MLSKQEALGLAESYFPKGPEAIAEAIGAEVRILPVSVDGWCLHFPEKRPIIITLKESAPETRRRFTLAHEVAHLILGTRPDVLTQIRDVLNPKNQEERDANELASDLLLPLPCLRSIVKTPIDLRRIREGVKAAKVSEAVLLLRLARNTTEFGLVDPVVIHLEGTTLMWKYPFDARLDGVTAVGLFRSAIQNGDFCRLTQPDGIDLLACAFGEHTYPILFCYKLEGAECPTELPGEALHRLEQILFGEFAEYQPSLAGKFGAFKEKVKRMKIEEAIAAFNKRYAESDDPNLCALFNSEIFQQYIRVRLGEWCLPD